ncbi:hypothetical protein BDV98DRAFT_255593 [Pterulicium gracile]|uniref:Uncharacterized protein n=1 Tax=Pterulicium gracile TaxID=1884261 RepID=A0A5C3QHE2_9AGAR|nr:hypothetical protein BDV98DRAFT_255593 [Pterula gracilis]
MVASDPPPSYSSVAKPTPSSHRSHKQHKKPSDIVDDDNDKNESIGAHQHAPIRAKYSPEFLKDFASKNQSSSGDVLLDGTKLKLISGADATQFASEYLKTVKSIQNPSSKAVSRPAPTNVVFAMPTFNAVGRRALDFYMANATDIPKTHPLKGTKRRKNFLDKEEFSKINDAVTREYKRMSALLTGGVQHEEKASENVKKGSPLAGEVTAADEAQEEARAESRPDDKGEGPSHGISPPRHQFAHRSEEDTGDSSRKEERSEGRRRRRDRSRSGDRHLERRHRRDPDPNHFKDKEAHDRTSGAPPTLPEPASEDVLVDAVPVDKASSSGSRRSRRRDEDRGEGTSRRRSRRSEEDDAESRHEESGHSRRSRRHESRRGEERSGRRDGSRDTRRSRRHRDRRDDHDEDARSRRSHSRERRRRDDSKESRSTRRSERRRSRSRDKDRSERRERRERRAREKEEERARENAEEAAAFASAESDDVDVPEDSQSTIKARRPNLVARGSVMSLPYLSTNAASPPSNQGDYFRWRINISLTFLSSRQAEIDQSRHPKHCW